MVSKFRSVDVFLFLFHLLTLLFNFFLRQLATFYCDYKMWTSNESSLADVNNRQKQSHVKAFALISRALELDERESGKSCDKTFFFFSD